MYTEKHTAFFAAIEAVNAVDERITFHEKEIEKLKIERAQKEDIRDAAASEAAAEKIEANLAAIEMPDGTFRFVGKARRGKKTESNPDGTPPKYPFLVSDKVLRT